MANNAVTDFQYVSASYGPSYDKDIEAAIWKMDGQPEKSSSSKHYTSLAKNELRVPSAARVADILIDAGYIKQDDRGNTIFKIATLKKDEELKLEGVSVKHRIKEDRAIKAKIAKDAKRAHDIGDYDAYKLIGETVDDVRRLGNAVRRQRTLTSQKDEFLYPSEEGFRSLKTHHLIEANRHKLSIEVMVVHAGFEAIEKLTHNLLEKERNSLANQIRANETAAKSSISLSNKFAVCSLAFHSKRANLNFKHAEALGLNSLCAPDAVTEYQAPAVPNGARKMLERFSPETQALFTTAAIANNTLRRDVA